MTLHAFAPRVQRESGPDSVAPPERQYRMPEHWGPLFIRLTGAQINFPEPGPHAPADDRHMRAGEKQICAAIQFLQQYGEFPYTFKPERAADLNPTRRRCLEIANFLGLKGNDETKRKAVSRALWGWWRKDWDPSAGKRTGPRVRFPGLIERGFVRSDQDGLAVTDRWLRPGAPADGPGGPEAPRAGPAAGGARPRTGLECPTDGRGGAPPPSGARRPAAGGAPPRSGSPLKREGDQDVKRLTFNADGAPGGDGGTAPEADDAAPAGPPRPATAATVRAFLKRLTFNADGAPGGDGGTAPKAPPKAPAVPAGRPDAPPAPTPENGPQAPPATGRGPKPPDEIMDEVLLAGRRGRPPAELAPWFLQRLDSRGARVVLGVDGTLVPRPNPGAEPLSEAEVAVLRYLKPELLELLAPKPTASSVPEADRPAPRVVNEAEIWKRIGALRTSGGAAELAELIVNDPGFKANDANPALTRATVRGIASDVAAGRLAESVLAEAFESSCRSGVNYRGKMMISEVKRLKGANLAREE